MQIVFLLLLQTTQSAPATGRLAGRVLDAGGTPLSDAVVVAESLEVSRAARSAADGSFAIEELLPGHYRIDAQVEQRSPGRAEVTVGAGEESSVSVTVGPAPTPASPVPYASGGLFNGLPLWSRSPAAALRLSLASRARAGIRPRFAGAQAGAEWQLDGFDFTHPVTGAPAVAVGFEAVVAPGVSEIGSGAWGVGPRADLVLLSGSNKTEADATAVGRVGPERAIEGNLRGPVVRDRLWLMLAGQAETGAEPGSRARALGKLTWQVNARNKLTLLSLAAAGQAGSNGAALAGLAWESLPSDVVLTSVRLSVLHDARQGLAPPLLAWTGQGRVDYFLSTRSLGEHHLALSARGSRLNLAGATGMRGHAAAEESWRPTRHLTLGGSLGFSRASLLDGAGVVGGPSGTLSMAWDANHDGRTAARLRAGTATVPGLVAAGCPDCPRSTRIDEAAAGLEREVAQGSAAGVELLFRRARIDAGTPEREALVALHASHRRPGYKLAVLYQARFLPALRSEVTALAGLGLTRWLSAGALIIRAPRDTWLPLFDEEPGPLVPAAGGTAWLLGLQLRAELGSLLGVASALWLDALNLTNDRGTLATGPAPIRTPPFQVRLGLRVEY